MAERFGTVTYSAVISADSRMREYTTLTELSMPTHILMYNHNLLQLNKNPNGGQG